MSRVGSIGDVVRWIAEVKHRKQTGQGQVGSVTGDTGILQR